MVDWRQDREKEEDEERKEAGGGQHLTGSVSFLTTESDMISGNKEKRIQYRWSGWLLLGGLNSASTRQQLIDGRMHEMAKFFLSLNIFPMFKVKN